MKQKRIYSKPRVLAVQLSGKSALLSGSPTFQGSSDGARLMHGSYTEVSYIVFN